MSQFDVDTDLPELGEHMVDYLSRQQTDETYEHYETDHDRVQGVLRDFMIFLMDKTVAVQSINQDIRMAETKVVTLEKEMDRLSAEILGELKEVEEDGTDNDVGQE